MKCGAILYAGGDRERPLSALDANLADWLRCRVPGIDPALKALERGPAPGTLATRLFEAGRLDAGLWVDWLREANAAPRLLIPEYDLVSCLGRGGMGMVWHGRHIAANLPVAVKLLTGRFADPEEDRKRFLREARVAVTLDHPNIVKGYGPGMLGSMPYYVMEYVHGKSAGRALEKGGRFKPARALDIARQTARALAYAARRDVVHRDVKPDNLLLAVDGSAKLADYGIAARAGAPPSYSRAGASGVRSKRLFGTPAYVAPEQARGEAVDIRADLYALGATLFHMLTGQPPFSKPTMREIVRAHCYESAPDPRGLHPELPAAAAALTLRLLAKNPDDRCRTPDDVIREIDAMAVAGGALNF